MKKKTLLYIPFFLFVFLLILIFRPITNPSLDNCQKIVGTISSISIQEETQDIFVKMEGDPVDYYINRGLKQLGLKDLLSSYTGQKITIYPINHWTPLDFKQRTKHIARVEIGSEIVFDETTS